MTPANAISNRIVLECSGRTASNLAILIAACLILINAILHSQVYGNRNYREDEIVVVHMSLQFSPSELVQYTATDIHPPGWRLLANAWIEVFGITEEVTRWLAVLTNLITFALMYQFGSHFGGKLCGCYAVFLLGLYGFASNSMSELRPYSMMIMLTTALNLVFLRWLRQPTSTLMYIYVVAGMAAIYTHYFSFFVFPAHAICLLLYRRFDRQIWLNSAAMWTLIAASFVGWLLPFGHNILVSRLNDFFYHVPNSWRDWSKFLTHISFKPELIYQFLLILSLIAIVGHLLIRVLEQESANQFSAALFPITLLLSYFAIAYLVGHFVSSWSTRNAVVFAPLIAILLALGLRTLPTSAAVILMALLYLQASQNLHVQTSNAPYREIVHEMSANPNVDRIVVTEFNWAWRWLLAAAYYIMDFSPDNIADERMFHIIGPNDSSVPLVYPEGLIHEIKKFDALAFDNLLPEHRQLWHLQQGGGNQYRDDIEGWLNGRYAHIRTIIWDEEYITSYSLSEYARVPEHEGPILEVGENLRMYAWARQAPLDTAPCQAVTIESWWQIQGADPTPYTISLILADEDGDGQLVISDSVPSDKFTSDWEPARFYRDRTSLVIPCEIGAGQYNLLLAAKESNTGVPLLLAYPNGDAFGTEYYLTTLTVNDA